MKIERAGPGDLHDLVRLGQAMRDESTVRFPQIDAAAVDAHLRLAMKHPDRMYFAIARTETTPTGFVSGMIGSYVFSGARHAVCDLLFVLPAYRGRYAGVRLLRALCRWASDRGAQEIELGISTGIDPDRTGILLEKIGFAPLGRTYRKEIDPCARPQPSR